MATPNSFLNRYSSLPYGVGYAQWPVAHHSLYALGGGLPLGQLQQHLAFNYMQQLPFFTLPSLPAQSVPPILTTPPVQARPRAPLAQPPRSSLQNKIQKSGIKVSGSAVIEISDDSLPIQPQKSPEEKTVSTTPKPPQKQPQHLCPITPALIQELKLQPTTTPLPPRQHHRQKNKVEQKIPKIKEIYKPSHHKKRVDDRPNEAVAGRRGAIFSQRIIQRKETRLEPYRLSKRQRELLQISLLREMASEIMTGPQFQARLPPFLSAGRERESALQQWKKELREKLLERVEKKDE